jgi:hypothetical protein
MVERLREKLSTEQLSQRLDRLLKELDRADARAASDEATPQKPASAPRVRRAAHRTRR